MKTQTLKKVKDIFTIKIPPTMAYVLEEQGELSLELGGKYYKLISEIKLQEAGEVAVRETLDYIAHNEGWEESRDFYAKKFGIKLKYTKKKYVK